MTIKKTAAIVAAVAMISPVAAFADMNSSAIVIAAQNNGVLISNTTSNASTGSNTAGGSRGGRGGSGGDVEGGAGVGNNGGATAGNGGTGGNGGPGGLVTTGDAESDAGSMSSLNSNDIDVGGDGEDMNSSAVAVLLDNASGISMLAQNTGAAATTGDNTARGSRGGRGGSGGEVEADGSGNNGGATAGTGGHGGTGGLGGEVVTGGSTSNAGSIQMMNTNLVRVRN